MPTNINPDSLPDVRPDAKPIVHGAFATLGTVRAGDGRDYKINADATATIPIRVPAVEVVFDYGMSTTAIVLTPAQARITAYHLLAAADASACRRCGAPPEQIRGKCLNCGTRL
jgi:hypothetical protein